MWVGVHRILGCGKRNPKELYHLASAGTRGPCLMSELQTELVGKILSVSIKDIS